MSRGWNHGGWLGHCWLRGRRHVFAFFAYRHWPHALVEVCVRCGRLREVRR